MEDALDHLGARILLAGWMGSVTGAVRGLIQGHPTRLGLRTAGFTGFSCALAATACLGSERLVANAVAGSIAKAAAAADNSENAMDAADSMWRETTIATHAVGGAMGGSVLGGLYLGKPIRGMLLFVPLTALWGFGECIFRDLRAQKQLQQQQLEWEQQEPNVNSDNEKQM